MHARGPMVGVGAVILDGGRILLVMRGNDPGRGLWSVPGGRPNWGEPVKEALAREVFEETGLEVEVLDLAGTAEIITPVLGSEVEFHYVLLDYYCRVVSGEPHAGDDAMEVGWHKVGSLSALATTDGLAEKARDWLTRYKRLLDSPI